MGVVRAHSSQNSCRSYFPCSINLCFSSRNTGRAALSWAPQVRWGLQSALANERWAEGRHYFEQSLKYCCTVCHPLFPCQRGQGRQRMMGRGASHLHPQGPRKTSVWRRNKHIVFILKSSHWKLKTKHLSWNYHHFFLVAPYLKLLFLGSTCPGKMQDDFSSSSLEQSVVNLRAVWTWSPGISLSVFSYSI